MNILKNKLGTFWLALIVASVCNILLATTKGMDMMLDMNISPRSILIVGVILLIYSYFRLYIKKDTECGGKTFFSFKSYGMQRTIMWINALLVFSMFFGCNIGLPW
ncbi:MAG: hypothetical protein K0T99_02105 [Alphaproteobacteria bacterium]|nr:hypothetical protein [Alphaproteobacteria bacterium]